FTVLVAVSFVASALLRTWLYPPKPELPPEAKALSDFLVRRGAVAISQSVPALDDAVQNETNWQLAKYVANRRYRLPYVPVAAESKKESKPAVAKKPQPPVAQKPLPRAEHKKYWLGDDSFFLKVKLTSLGAGVESVLLTQFKAASKMGRPEDKTMELLLEEMN